MSAKMMATTKKSKSKKPAIQGYNDSDSTSGKKGGKSTKRFNIFKKG